jgi:uncharacterized membrane protein YtjA (UPF0391 family)
VQKHTIILLRAIGLHTAFLLATKLISLKIGRVGLRFAANILTHKLKGYIMLRWALIFLVVALIAAVLGFGGIAGSAAGIAKIIFGIFVILLIISIVMNMVRGKR